MIPTIDSDKTFASSPLVTQERWAEMTGLSVGSVQAAVSRRIWPFVKIGRHKFINVEAVRIAAAKKADDFVLL